MTNQAVGYRAERRVVEFLQGHGWPGAHRMVVHHPDRGDVGGVQDVTIEVKSIGRDDIAALMNQMRLAHLETGTPYGMLVKQRRNYPADRWFAIMELSNWAALATAAGLDAASVAARAAS